MQATLEIEGYDSFEQIALGGMAAVYKARKKSIKKPVAIKVLFPHLAADDRFTERLRHEAEAAARVRHDNIVNVIDFGEQDGSYYIVMEYYDGLTAEELLRGQPSLPIHIAFAIVLNVCYGLEAAHQETLVHRDIKPANIILTQQGGVKVADFGLARSTEQLKRTTLDGKVIGTPAYMSPEQAGGGRVGVASDIFSLGVVAYELVCGVRPFEGSGYMEVVDAIQNRALTPPSKLNPLVEEPFEEIFERMLAKDPQKRYESVSEVIADLQAAMDRYGYKRDNRMLADFCADPATFTNKWSHELLEELSASIRRSSDQDRDAVILRYQRIAFVDPSDQGARKELLRLGAQPIERPEASRDPAPEPEPSGPEPVEPSADVKADYAVYLDAIDESRESRDSFALKLSMKIKTPLPRIKTMVNNIPCRLFAKVPYEKAVKLVRVIERMGGEVRMEAIPLRNAPAAPPAAPPAKAGKSSGPSDGFRAAKAPTEEQETAKRGLGWDGRTCPACGSAEDPEAWICSFCGQNFHSTVIIDQSKLRRRQEIMKHNPLDTATRPSSSLWGMLQEGGSPRNIMLIAVGSVVVVLLLIIFSR